MARVCVCVCLVCAHVCVECHLLHYFISYIHSLKISDNYYVLEDQSPETTVNISVRAFTRWYTSEAAEITVLSPSRGECVCVVYVLWCFVECDMRM